MGVEVLAKMLKVLHRPYPIARTAPYSPVAQRLGMEWYHSTRAILHAPYSPNLEPMIGA